MLPTFAFRASGTPSSTFAASVLTIVGSRVLLCIPLRGCRKVEKTFVACDMHSSFVLGGSIFQNHPTQNIRKVNKLSDLQKEVNWFNDKLKRMDIEGCLKWLS